MIFDAKNLKQAKEEGRICENCGWMVNKKRWANGKRTCASCEDALRGMGKLPGAFPPRDEQREMTGES